MGAVWVDRGKPRGQKARLLCMDCELKASRFAAAASTRVIAGTRKEQHCQRSRSQGHTSGDCYARVRDASVGFGDPV